MRQTLGWRGRVLRRVRADEATSNVLQEFREPGKDAEVLVFQVGSPEAQLAGFGC
jgi:hypothetical protein